MSASTSTTAQIGRAKIGGGNRSDGDCNQFACVAKSAGVLVSMKYQRCELYWPTHLSEDDREQLLALYDEVARREATHGYAGSLANEVGRSIVDADAESLATGHIYMLLARDVDGLAGSLIFEPYTSQSRKHTMYAKRAVIARRARGKFFHQAVAEAVNKAVALGAEVMTCDVAADGPVELWKSLGFKEYGILPDYARRHGRSVDGHFLYLRLTSTGKSSSAAG